MTKDEALDLALEALEKSVATCFDRCAHEQVMSRPEHFINQAITAIKQARALDKMAENARELGLDYESVHKPYRQLQDNGSQYFGDSWDTPPAQPAPVAFEVGLVEWVGNKLMATPKTTTTPPASWMEVVTANLVREGVNKHKARELAEHFYGLAQRPFVGLTDDQIRGLTPKPDGVAEAGVRRVEVLPGVMGTEFDEVDAWSMQLVLKIARAIEAAHGITAAPEKGQL
jgi:hypothetical protein